MSTIIKGDIMFPFAHLPPEIALDVLAASANARGIARALRMRLVSVRSPCRSFPYTYTP